MKTKLVAATTAVALLIVPVSALAATPPSTSPSAVSAGSQAGTQQTVNWQVPLRAGSHLPRATGSAQYQAQPGQREFQVEVEHLRALAGRSLVVQVNARTLGQMKVSPTGIAQLTRNSEHGQAVPLVVHGSTVSVKTMAGAVIASARF